MKFLIECGANVNCAIVGGQSPLCKAAENKNLNLVEFIVANGADLNQRLPSCEGGTILHHVCSVFD